MSDTFQPMLWSWYEIGAYSFFVYRNKWIVFFSHLHIFQHPCHVLRQRPHPFLFLCPLFLVYTIDFPMAYSTVQSIRKPYTIQNRKIFFFTADNQGTFLSGNLFSSFSLHFAKSTELFPQRMKQHMFPMMRFATSYIRRFLFASAKSSSFPHPLPDNHGRVFHHRRSCTNQKPSPAASTVLTLNTSSDPPSFWTHVSFLRYKHSLIGCSLHRHFISQFSQKCRFSTSFSYTFSWSMVSIKWSFFILW